jgi:DNA-directed RNA polymerase subunit F
VVTVTDEAGDSEAAGGLGLWVPVSELAEMRGIARQVMYRKLEPLLADEKIEARVGPRGQRLFSPAQVDRALAEVEDLARVRGAETRRRSEADADAPQAPAEPSSSQAYNREQARRMAYQADLSRLELEERLGKLVAVDRLRAAVRIAAETTSRVIMTLPQEADELRAICARDEGRELERALKRIANRMRETIAAAIEAGVPGAPMPEERAPGAPGEGDEGRDFA